MLGNRMPCKYKLGVLIAQATEWAELQARLILRDGVALNINEISLAGAAGVAYPERIRIFQVTHIPYPGNMQLIEMATNAGLLTPDIAGLTLGYGIYLRHGYCTQRILSHEFRHVYQYEQAGSIAAFLTEYLQQIAQYGYANAPLEMDARKYEVATD